MWGIWQYDWVSETGSTARFVKDVRSYEEAETEELLETSNREKIEPQLKYSINLITNIDRFFQYAPAEAKIKALSSIFPEKIEFVGNNFELLV